MLRIAISVLLAISAVDALAKNAAPALGACVYDAKNYCGANVGIVGVDKQPVPCLMSHKDRLTQECQATIEKAMMPVKKS